MLLATLLIAAALVDNVETNSVTTNRYVVSNVITKKAWHRDFPSVDTNGVLIDASGKIATMAQNEAVQLTLLYADELSDAAQDGLTNTIAKLSTATNGVTDRMESFSLQLMRRSSANLQGNVVASWYDGIYDWQCVKFNKVIAKAPKRKIVYTTPSGEASAECDWGTWIPSGITTNGYGGCHICKAVRPTSIGSGKTLTMVNDIFGGEQGFDFGSMTVFVDGAMTVTGVYTGKTSQAILEISNGVIKKWEK